MNKKKIIPDSKIIYMVIGIAALLVALACAMFLAVKQYRLWKAGQMYEKLAESTTVPSTTMSLEDDMDDDIELENPEEDNINEEDEGDYYDTIDDMDDDDSDDDLKDLVIVDEGYDDDSDL